MRYSSMYMNFFCAALLVMGIGFTSCSISKDTTELIPSNELQWLIDTMDGLGYKSTMPENAISPKVIDLTKHELSESKPTLEGGMPEAGKVVFRDALKAWYYSYKMKTDKPMKPSGTIEEWVFKSTGDAGKAMEMLQKYYPNPYFNTSPHYIQKDNRVFAFSTRAMAFSYDQKPHFEALKKKLGKCKPLSRL